MTEFRDLLYAALLAPILAIGPLPGVVALTLFSVAVPAELGSETVAAADPGPLEAVRVAGIGLPLVQRLPFRRWEEVPMPRIVIVAFVIVVVAASGRIRRQLA